MYHIQKNLKESIPRRSRASRAAAEIELLLVIPILLFFLFLINGMFFVGTTRIFNIGIAEVTAYQDATVSSTPLYANSPDLELTPGEPNLQIDFPNEMSVSNAVAPVHIKISNLNLPAFAIVDKAAFATPAWAYSNWPNANDAPQIDAWMQNYNDQFLSEYQGPLDLAPAWPP